MNIEKASFGGNTPINCRVNIEPSPLEIIEDFAKNANNDFPIKGGMALHLLYGTENPSARPTLDIDYHVKRSNDWERFKYSISNIKSNLGYTYKLSDDKATRNGERLNINYEHPKFSNGQFKIDMNYGDYCDCRTLGVIKVYSPYSILADKLSVIFSKNIRRRPKDLYDVYLVLQHEDINLDRLKTVMKEKGRVLPKYLSLLDGEIIKDIYIGYKNLKLIDKPDFKVVYNTILDFIISLEFPHSDLVWSKDKQSTGLYVSLAYLFHYMNGIIVGESASYFNHMSTYPNSPITMKADIDLDLGKVIFMKLKFEIDGKDLIGAHSHQLDNNEIVKLFYTNQLRTILDLLINGEVRILEESVDTILSWNNEEDLQKYIGKYDETLLYKLGNVIKDIEDDEYV